VSDNAPCPPPAPDGRRRGGAEKEKETEQGAGKARAIGGTLQKECSEAGLRSTNKKHILGLRAEGLQQHAGHAT
jgi:hypothetical protein